MPLKTNLMERNVSDNESSGGEEYEVEQILDMRVLEDGTEEFRVRWKNYGSDEDSWEPRDNLGGAKTALNKFLKAKKLVKKVSKSSGTPAKGRKRKADGNGHGIEDGTSVRSSSEGQSDDDDFSVSSSSKKKKTPGKKKKASAGRLVTSAGRSSSASRPTPHNGDSLTMAINRRMNLGQHSSWLESGSESDSNSTTAKNKGTSEGGKGGTTAKGAEVEKPKGSSENGKTIASSHAKNNDDIDNISDDSTATEKLANSPSPHFDNETKGDEDEQLNMRSEHDPTPANLSSVLNGSISKLSSKELSISVEYASKTSSKEKSRVTRSPLGMHMKRTEQSPKTSKTKEAPLQFDGIYRNAEGELQIVVQGTDNNRRVLTLEEATNEDPTSLCTYLSGLIKFTEDGRPNIQIPVVSHNTETDEQDGKESRMREDGKLNFGE